MPSELVELIEDLALHKPKLSAAAIHRRITPIASTGLDGPILCHGCMLSSMHWILRLFRSPRMVQSPTRLRNTTDQHSQGSKPRLAHMKMQT